VPVAPGDSRELRDGGAGRDGLTARPTADPWPSRPPAPAPPAGLDSIYAGYFALQAFVGIVLWAMAGAIPSVRSLLDIFPAKAAVTSAFEIADLTVTVVASAFATWGIGARKRWATPAAAFAAGTVVYPTMFLVGWVALTGTGSGVLAIMIAPAILSCWVAAQVYRAAH
jgi:hypothetical protein